MVDRVVVPLPLLYHEDETAWLEVMAQLAAEGRFDEIDYEHLSEFLSDMRGAIDARSPAIWCSC